MSATRTLATELGLSRNVIMQAYEQLLAEGYLIARTRPSPPRQTVPRKPPQRRRLRQIPYAAVARRAAALVSRLSMLFQLIFAKKASMYLLFSAGL